MMSITIIYIVIHPSPSDWWVSLSMGSTKWDPTIHWWRTYHSVCYRDKLILMISFLIKKRRIEWLLYLHYFITVVTYTTIRSSPLNPWVSLSNWYDLLGKTHQSNGARCIHHYTQESILLQQYQVENRHTVKSETNFPCLAILTVKSMWDL